MDQTNQNTPTTTDSPILAATRARLTQLIAHPYHQVIQDLAPLIVDVVETFVPQAAAVADAIARIEALEGKATTPAPTDDSAAIADLTKRVAALEGIDLPETEPAAEPAPGPAPTQTATVAAGA